MNKAAKYLTIECILALLLIVSYFLPWVDMSLFIKVVGWDLPQVQKTMSEISKEFVENKSVSNIAYLIYIVPLLSLASIILGLLLKNNIARITLAAASIIGIILAIYLLVALPQLGSGVYMLCLVSFLSIVVAILGIRNKKRAK